MPDSKNQTAFRREGWRIVEIPYIIYKLFNSLFLGLSVGSIFTIYKPLDPSIYSVGGILLAVAMLAIAQLYAKIMTMAWFFRISLLVELVMLAMLLFFLARPYTWLTAILVYAGYQITFSFGSYLVRAETLALDSDEILRRVDSAKQIGYLIGMASSWLAYKLMEHYDITTPEAKVYNLHWLLLGTEFVILYFLLRSFGRVTSN